MLSFLRLKRRREVPDFIIDLYRQNYLDEDPARFLHQKFHEVNGYRFLKATEGLSVNTYPPGISFRKFKKIAPDILVDQRFRYGRHSVRRVMTADRIAHIQRVSVLIFLNNKLISSRCHFPHLAGDEKEELTALAKGKYFNGEGPDELENICLRGDNGVELFFRDFVSVSFHYLHRTPEATSTVDEIIRFVDERRTGEMERRQKELMERI